jgi:DNA-directed RNA polymerase specialized sigma24 family protein
MGHVEEFTSFARDRTPLLLRPAYLLTGDQHLAKDLVQASLGCIYLAWRRVGERETLRHTPEKSCTTSRSTGGSGARYRSRLPVACPSRAVKAPDVTDGGDIKLILRAALRKLPPKQRAVLVLRFFEDHTEAELPDVRLGATKSQTARGLARPRAIAPELAHLYHEEEAKMASLGGLPSLSGPYWRPGASQRSGQRS